jgi:HK97 gp10 family phage protein
VLIEAANFILTEMEARVPVDSGDLRRSLAIRVEGSRIIIGPNTPYAAYVEFGTAPHEIRPKKPNGVLRWQQNGQIYYARVVHHPGTKPQPFVRDSFEAWRKTLPRNVAKANVKVITDQYRK